MSDLLTPDPRESKLPVWTQATLRLLRARLTEERASHEITAGKTPPSRITVDPYRRHDDKPTMYLPDRTTIRFQFREESDNRPSSAIDVRFCPADGNGPDRLLLAADGSAYNPLVVRPVVSNAVELLFLPKGT